MYSAPESLKRDIDVLRSKERYLNAGMPKFLGLFGRDCAISGWQFLEFDKEIAKSSLVSLANLQGKKFNESNREEPGKILHEYYPPYTKKDWFFKYKDLIPWLHIGVPAYFSVDSTPLFIILYLEYFKRFKDRKFAMKLLPNVKAAANWIVDQGIVDGLVRYYKCSSKNTGLLSQSWKDGFGNTIEEIPSPVGIVEVQGYAYYALRNFAEVVRNLDESYDTSPLVCAADLLKMNLKRMWIAKENFYALGIDGNENTVERITSNPGHLLFTNILTKKEADLVVKRLFKPDMMTPYGIRTQSTKSVDFDELSYQRGSVWPHDNWMIAIGLRKLGYKREYEKIRNAVLNAYAKLRGTPEYYGVSKEGRLIPKDELRVMPCEPQAWTVGTIYSFLNRI